MKNWSIRWMVAVPFVIGLVVSSVAAGDERPRPGLATVETVGSAVAFRPISSTGLTLEVSGIGYESAQKFRVGEGPFFVPVDREGYALPDGLYKWDLIETPELPRAFGTGSKVAENGRDTLQLPATPGRRQSGAFTILSGRVVDWSLVEPEMAPAARDRAVEPEAAAVPFDDSDAGEPGSERN